MPVPSTVYEAVARVGFQLMQQQRLGLGGCTEPLDLASCCEWLLIHQQLRTLPPPGLALHDTVASSSFCHDSPSPYSKSWHRATC